MKKYLVISLLFFTTALMAAPLPKSYNGTYASIAAFVAVGTEIQEVPVSPSVWIIINNRQLILPELDGEDTIHSIKSIVPRHYNLTTGRLNGYEIGFVNRTPISLYYKEKDPEGLVGFDEYILEYVNAYGNNVMIFLVKKRN